MIGSVVVLLYSLGVVIGVAFLLVFFALCTIPLGELGEYVCMRDLVWIVAGEGRLSYDHLDLDLDLEDEDEEEEDPNNNNNKNKGSGCPTKRHRCDDIVDEEKGNRKRQRGERTKKRGHPKRKRKEKTHR